MLESLNRLMVLARRDPEVKKRLLMTRQTDVYKRQRQRRTILR